MPRKIIKDVIMQSCIVTVIMIYFCFLRCDRSATTVQCSRDAVSLRRSNCSDMFKRHSLSNLPLEQLVNPCLNKNTVADMRFEMCVDFVHIHDIQKQRN